MKQPKTNLKLAILLMGIFLFFTNCQEQEAVEPIKNSQGKYLLKRVKGNEINNNISLTEKLSELKQKNGTINGYEARYNNVQFNLNLNEAAYIESTDGSLHSYTFSIYNEDDSYDINNIVLVSYNGQEYEAYLSTYTLTQEERNQLANGINLDLSQKASIQPFDINQINTYSRVGGSCFDLVLTDETYENCSAGHNVSSCTTQCCGSCYGYIFQWEEVPCPGSGGGGVTGGDTGSGNTGTGTGVGGTGNGSGNTFPTIPVGIKNENDPSEEQKPKTKCQSLKDLTKTDSLSVNIKPIIDSLRTKVNLDKEWSINFKKKMNYGELYSLPEEGGIKEGISETRSKLKSGNTWFGQVHTHPKGTYEIFSWLDLKALNTIYTDVHHHFKDDVFLMVVADSNLVYALKVDNINTLTTKLDVDYNNAKGDDDDEKTDNIERNMTDKYKKSDNLEQAFLKLYGSYGISLYKATDANLSNWKLLELDETDNETVNETPCN